MISLEKKQKMDLTKREPALSNVRVGLSWDESSLNGKSPDADSSVFMLGENGRMPSDGYFVFYNNLKSSDNAVVHHGDNRSGAGEGDDEVIEVNLQNISRDVVQIVFAVTIHNAGDGFNFGNTTNAAVRVYNNANNKGLCQYQLQDKYPDCDSLILGRLYRSGSDWEFEAIGSAFSGGLQACLEMYG